MKQPISPAAQAVLDAAQSAYWSDTAMAPNDSNIIAAAAIRAAAQQAIPNPGKLPPPGEHLAGHYVHGRADAQNVARERLLDIASELEGYRLDD